jgi:hypothetical protein
MAPSVAEVSYSPSSSPIPSKANLSEPKIPSLKDLSVKPVHTKPESFPTPPQLQRMNANDPATTPEALSAIIEKDGGVIVENLVPLSLVEQIKSDLAPHFNTDKVDKSGFFPSTTQRATGLLAISDACVELALNPLYNEVANQLISSTYTYWVGQEQETCTSKPQISSTVGFRVNPGGKQQGLHRDDSDYHTRGCDMPVMLGCVTALTKTTKGMSVAILLDFPSFLHLILVECIDTA